MTAALRSTTTRVLALTLIVVLAGCASSPPGPAPRARPSTAAFTDVRRVVVVATGDSRFTVMQEARSPGRTFDDVMRWLPYKELLAPIARAVYSGLNRLIDGDATGTLPKDVVPGAVVSEAFARALQVSGPFNQIVPLDREPVGDDRRHADAIVRLTVPSWGLMRVREGQGDVVAGFADVRAQMVVRETGVVVWEHEEDITHPGRLSLDAFKRDPALARQELVDVLERAGRRLASELIYARDGGR